MSPSWPGRLGRAMRLLVIHKQGLALKRWVFFVLEDWFHSLLNTSTASVLFVVVTLYLIYFVAFAVGYYLAEEACSLGINTFLDALFFRWGDSVLRSFVIPTVFLL